MAETLGVVCALREYTTRPISDCCISVVSCPKVLSFGLFSRLSDGPSDGPSEVTTPLLWVLCGCYDQGFLGGQCLVRAIVQSSNPHQ